MGRWAVCRDVIALAPGHNYTNVMGVRILFLSLVVAVVAATVPSFLADPEAHSAEAWRVVPTAVVDVAEPSPTPMPPTVDEPDEVESLVVIAPSATAPATTEPTPTEPSAPAPSVTERPNTPEDEVDGDEPAASEPASDETSAEPAALSAVDEPPVAEESADTAPPVVDPQSEVDESLFAPATIAGYSVGDLAPQTASGLMLPEGVDVDPNSDMVEILIPSVGQGAMFPAEIEADYSTDMVAIVIPDGEPFPAEG